MCWTLINRGRTSCNHFLFHVYKLQDKQGWSFTQASFASGMTEHIQSRQENTVHGWLTSRIKDWYTVQHLKVLWRIWWKTANWKHANLYVDPTGNQRDFKEGHDLSIFLQVNKKAHGTHVPLIAMTIKKPEILQSRCTAVQCTTVTFALMRSELSHARLKTYSLPDHIFCDGKWIVSAYENCCKICVADFTAVMWTQIHKLKMQKKKKK